MDFSNIKKLMPEHAKDLKLNVSSVLTPEGAPGLTRTQILATAVASALAARNDALSAEVAALASEELDPAHMDAARAAASIMGMNNVYYRFMHLIGEEEYSRMPARLRMQVIGNPGIDKTDFELYSLAVSAINGCASCMLSHEKAVRKGGISAQGVQSAVRIAAVMHGAAIAIESKAPSEAKREAA